MRLERIFRCGRTRRKRSPTLLDPLLMAASQDDATDGEGDASDDDALCKRVAEVLQSLGGPYSLVYRGEIEAEIRNWRAQVLRDDGVAPTSEQVGALAAIQAALGAQAQQPEIAADLAAFSGREAAPEIVPP